MRSTTSRTRPLEHDNFLLEKRARVYRCNQCDAHTSEMINFRRQTDLVTELPCFRMTYLVRTYDTINFDRIRSDGGQNSGERLTLKVPRRSGQILSSLPAPRNQSRCAPSEGCFNYIVHILIGHCLPQAIQPMRICDLRKLAGLHV